MKHEKLEELTTEAEKKADELLKKSKKLKKDAEKLLKDVIETNKKYGYEPETIPESKPAQKKKTTRR